MRSPYYTLNTLQKRLLAVVLLTTFLFMLLGLRLFCLQVVDGETLQARAVDQWTRDLPLKAVRGKITDQKGRTLASSYTTYSVYVRPRAVTDFDQTAAVLATALQLDYEKLRSKIKKKVSEVTVAKGVDKDTVDAIKRSSADGILFGETSDRVYPYGAYLSRVLGYTNIDAEGSTGLENYYNDYLRGVDGKVLSQTDLTGITVKEGDLYLPGIAGMTLVTTIDVMIQRLCEEITADAMMRYSPKSASCFVMDVTNGGIVAMATSPSFNLNSPPRDDIETLNAMSKNLLVTDVYEPGSTFKIFTTAAALEENLTYAEDRFFDPGFRMVDGQRIRCWKTTGHGSQNLKEGVQNSCNCVFMDLALRLGTEKLYDYLKKFGFGAKSGIDFSGESRGIMMAESQVKNVDLARIGFGQAVAVTPVQVLAGVSAAVNGGLSVTPHFADCAVASDGEKYRLSSYESKRVISESTSNLLSEMLELVVSNGGGKNAQVPGYRIGGKTGTAQKYENGHIAQGKYVSSFVGFAPVDQPKYVVMVLVDEPTGWIYYGSQVAAPYAAKLFKGIFDYTGILPTEAQETIEEISMPEVCGLSLESALARLNQYGLEAEYEGDGYVLEQYPAAGAKIRSGGICALRLSPLT